MTAPSIDQTARPPSATATLVTKGIPPLRSTELHKVDMPLFEDDNIISWIAKIERFFQVGNYTDAEKLDLILLALDGDPLSWFNWCQEYQPFSSWSLFKTEVIDRFSATTAGSPNEALFRLRQDTTVARFVHDFEDLSAQVRGFSYLNLETLFLAGLKPAVYVLVKFFGPRGFKETVAAALRPESSSMGRLLEEMGREQPMPFSSSWEDTCKDKPKSQSHSNFSNSRTIQSTTAASPWRMRPHQPQSSTASSTAISSAPT